MANPAEINRRNLLASAAGLTVAGILPNAEPAAATAARVVDTATAAPPTLEVQGLNVCAATARRLMEIARRNEIRREAGLPLLQTVKELRRMKDNEAAQEFERFAALHWQAVWDQVLARCRETQGDPNWRPNWITGMGLQNKVRGILRERYAALRFARVNSVATRA